MQAGQCLWPPTDRVKQGRGFSHVPIWTGAKASDHAVRDLNIPETNVVGIVGVVRRDESRVAGRKIWVKGRVKE
jgi:hypothetical protein